MDILAHMQCVPCRGHEPTVSSKEVAELMPQIPEWVLMEQDGIKKLERHFKFKDFAQALAFLNLVGNLAEEEEHHPAILIEWGKVSITWWTHVLDGLHLNDFILAAKTDKLYQPMD